MPLLRLDFLFKTDQLIRVVCRFRQLMFPTDKIKYLRFFNFKGIIKLADKDISDDKIITDTAKEQHQDRGKYIETGIFIEQFQVTANL